MRWEDLATTDFAGLDLARVVAVLPVAAVEQHGPHLPLGTDAILCEAILDAALVRMPADAPILRLPTQRVGHSPEHGRFPGTLDIGAETLLALWCDLGRGVATAGVRRLVLLNGHGGQGSLVDLAAQRLRAERGLLVVRCSWYRIAPPEGAVSADERRWGLHGGLVETAMMLCVAPHLVRTERVADFRSRARALEAAHPPLQVEGETGVAWMAEDLHPSGATGRADLATADLGRRLLDHYADRLAAILVAAQAWPLPAAGGR